MKPNKRESRLITSGGYGGSGESGGQEISFLLPIIMTVYRQSTGRPFDFLHHDPFFLFFNPLS